MNRREALLTASQYVSIQGRGTSWTIIGPYRVSDLDGPSTEGTATSYQKAVARRTAWRAAIALTLLGLMQSEDDISTCQVEIMRAMGEERPHDLASVVNAVIAALTN